MISVACKNCTEGVLNPTKEGKNLILDFTLRGVIDNRSKLFLCSRCEPFILVNENMDQHVIYKNFDGLLELLPAGEEVPDAT